MSRISVHLVTWNSAKVLPEAIGSLKAQSFKDWSLVVVDNASNDGSVDIVRKKLPEATVLRNFKNRGFSHAHNQAIRIAHQKWALDDREGRHADERYVLVMNPDIILVPDFLERLVAEADGKPGIGSFGPKLLKVLPRIEEHDDPRFTETIDSTGLRMRRSRRVTERGSGEKDEGQYDDAREVFGVSGALALYRAEALDAAKIGEGEVFDEDFFAYKEDIDLAWRLRLLGYGAACVPEAVAYHYRGAGSPEKAGLLAIAKGRKGRSAAVNRLSARNQLLLLAKNDDWANALLHAPLVWGYELVKFLFTAVTAPKVLSAYLDAIRLFPKMWRKRSEIMKRRKISASEIRSWIGRKET